MLQCLQSARLPSARLPTSIWYLFSSRHQASTKSTRKLKIISPLSRRRPSRKTTKHSLAPGKIGPSNTTRLGRTKRDFWVRRSSWKHTRVFRFSTKQEDAFWLPRSNWLPQRIGLKQNMESGTQPRWLQKRFLETPCKACGLQRARNVWFWWIWRYRYPGARDSAW